MRTRFASLLLLSFGILVGGPDAAAQISFSSSDLPVALAAFSKAYVTTNSVDVSRWISSKGGPQRWDLSQSASPEEEVRTLEIVATSDGGHGADFTAAAFAERTTYASSGGQSWSYYSIAPLQGRQYFGFYDPVSNPAGPEVVFDAPTTDLPAHITFNQTWHREVSFQNVIDLGFSEINVLVHFSCDAIVDGYGTVILPSLGEVPALRVNELHTYNFQDTTLGFPIGQQFIRNYYWLVKGIGQAVQIISSANNTSAPPDNFHTAATLFRVFQSSTFSTPAAPRTVKNLHIARKGDQIFLNWAPAASATSYQIEAADTLPSSPAWQALGQTTDTFSFQRFDHSIPTQFYRVLTVP